MRVGEHQPDNVVFIRGQRVDIGHHNVNPRQVMSGKTNPKVNHQPFTLIAVKIEIHANLVRSAKRYKQ